MAICLNVLFSIATAEAHGSCSVKSCQLNWELLRELKVLFKFKLVNITESRLHVTRASVSDIISSTCFLLQRHTETQRCFQPDAVFLFLFLLLTLKWPWWTRSGWSEEFSVWYLLTSSWKPVYSCSSLTRSTNDSSTSDVSSWSLSTEVQVNRCSDQMLAYSQSCYRTF